MGRGHTVYTFRRTVWRRSLYIYSGCAEARSTFALYRIYARALELRNWFSVAVILSIPPESSRLCLADVEKVPTVVQMSLALVFGRHFGTLLKSSIPCNSPPDRSHRYRSFCCRRCTGSNHEIDASRYEWVEHSRHRQQGRGAVLRTHNHVSFLDCCYAFDSEREIFPTGVRV